MLYTGAMELRDLLTEDARCAARFEPCPITGLAADSRCVKPGFLFVAVPGTKADGSTFIPQALAAGAVAVMGEQAPSSLPGRIAFVQVANARRAIALAAARFFARQPATIAAVTGTSGKTSVAAFTRQIWTTLGHRAASIGTIGLVTPDTQVYGALTTPDPVALHRMLDGIARAGVTHLAIEASSHGLDQHRLDGVRVSIASFTNLTRDHLDYHPSVEAYRAAKLILFERIVRPGGTAVIAADSAEAAAVIAAARRRGLTVMTVGRDGDGIRLVDATIDGFAQTLRMAHAGREHTVRLPLVGGFQVENALVAAGQAIASGGDPAAVFAALERLEGARGRLELVGRRNGAPIFVDYAHKPDALAKALEALRPYVKCRLVVVFGAGGDRDLVERGPGGRLCGGGGKEVHAAQIPRRRIVTLIDVTQDAARRRPAPTSRRRWPGRLIRARFPSPGGSRGVHRRCLVAFPARGPSRAPRSA